MSLLETIINGAASQFGREFGRAGANILLNGKNSYTINDNRYDGRISQNDNSIVKAIKELKKVDFVSQNKANVSRLIDLTNIVIENLKFKGDASMSILSDYDNLNKFYIDKYEHGKVLIDSNYSDQTLDFLNEKRKQYHEVVDKFDNDLNTFLNNKYEYYNSSKRTKQNALKRAFPLWGFTGIHHFYLREKFFGVLSIFVFLLSIPLFIYFFNSTDKNGVLIIFLIISCIFFLLNIIHYFLLRNMSVEKFDMEYNKEYMIYKKIVNK
ncbi:hypothetical protein [Flavobacterium sp.]|jgi:lipopolysaccharide export LptBFGC system permease protein LptF|uniref:hypothetical protein n=1 Tax=Flavobacterium sp. TaxID=239 RepID=UPI0037BF9533